MDDLALTRQPTAALRRPEEGPVAFSPFTIIIIILGLRQNCNYVPLPNLLPAGVLEGRELGWQAQAVVLALKFSLPV